MASKRKNKSKSSSGHGIHLKGDVWMYSSQNDHLTKYRKARYTRTKKLLRSKFNEGKSICLKYIPQTDKSYSRRMIVGSRGNPIYYLALNRLGGRDSLDGEAYLICEPSKSEKLIKGRKLAWCSKNDTHILAVKAIPLTVAEITHKYSATYRTWKEIKMLREVTRLFNKNISPNLPIYYTSTICDNSQIEDYQNKNIIAYYNNGEQMDRILELIKEIGEIRKQIVGIKYYKEIKKQIDNIYQRHLKVLSKNYRREETYSSSSVLIFNEISDFDFTHLMENQPEFVLRREYILPTTFQILNALAAIQKHLGICHFDLHLSNVLVTKVLPGGVWHYCIDKIDYYIPNQGFLFKIWDFGLSTYVDKDDPEVIKKKISKQFTRFFRFNSADFKKKLDITFKKAAFRKYLFSFDIFRFFSSYHSKLIQSISKISKTTRFSTKSLTTSSKSTKNTRSLSSLSPRQINQLPELDILKKITDYAFEDIMYHMISPRIKNHNYRGNALQLIKRYFKKYTKKPENKYDIINFGKPFMM